MNAQDRLRSLFRGLLVSACALPACSGGQGAIEEGRGPSSTDVCLTPEELSLRIPAKATLGPRFDYAEAGLLEVLGATETRFTPVFTFGSKCATATDRARCEAALAKPPAPPASPTSITLPGRNSGYFCIRVTRGDTVSDLTSPQAARTLFLPIDTPEEAAMVLAADQLGSYCGRPPIERREDGTFSTTIETVRCGSGGNGTRVRQTVRLDVDGKQTVEGQVDLGPADGGECAEAVVGRRPDGFVDRHAKNEVTSTAGWFLRALHEEAASVVAFEQMVEELASFGAPPALVARAREAARDEARHARAMAELAERAGASEEDVARAWNVELAPRRARSLVELAVDDAIEGCVNEAFSALLAAHQAGCAGDEEVRRAMRSVADDELAHAALSWDVLAFARERMTAEQYAEVDAALAGALATLPRRVRRVDDAKVREEAGIPAADEARALAEGLARGLATLAA